jgi:hypothetical protein
VDAEIAAQPMPAVHDLRTVDRMRRTGYLERLRTIPAFRHCSKGQLEQVARLVDVVELPAGTVELDGRELVVTLDPVRALVVGRRAVPALLELAPELATEPREEVAWRAGSAGPALRLHPA